MRASVSIFIEDHDFECVALPLSFNQQLSVFICSVCSL